MDKYRELPSDKIGMMPGSAVYVGESPPQTTEINIHIYNESLYEIYNKYDFDQVSKALQEDMRVWIDISGLKDSDTITKLGNDFLLHPLLLEDVVNTHQRPKLDIYDNVLFIVFKLLDVIDKQLNYSTEQFSMVVKQSLLITFRESQDYSFKSLYKKLQSPASLPRTSNCDYLAYLVIDGIVDDYFNYVEQVGYALEKMEDMLISQPESIKLRELYMLKRRTLTLSRTIMPIRDIIHILLSDKNNLIEHKYILYFRDLHDHSIRLLQQIDLYREMTVGMLDLYLSTLNNRMNETMKVLTLFASIFIPLTFIAGIYGMNFEFMPELKWRYGYPAIMCFMSFIVVLMLGYFRRRKLI